MPKLNESISSQPSYSPDDKGKSIHRFRQPAYMGEARQKAKREYEERTNTGSPLSRAYRGAKKAYEAATSPDTPEEAQMRKNMNSSTSGWKGSR